MPSLAQRWSKLPRAARWLVVFGLLVGFYFGVVEPLLTETAEANARADRAAGELEAFREQADSLEGAETTIKIGLTNFGLVEMPDARATDASDRIDAVLRKCDVEDWSFQQQRGVPLGRDAAPGLVEDPDAEEVQRVVFNIQLTARADVVIDVIADLERSPELTAVGQIVLRRTDEERALVQANIQPETWIIVPKEGQR